MAEEHARLVWRDTRTPTRAAWLRIGPWPARDDRRAGAGAKRNGSRIGSPSVRHAGAVWEAARTAASRAAQPDVPAAMTDLAMVTAIGRHISTCDRCWRTGPMDSVTPAQWLTWGVRSKPSLWRVFAPVLTELGVSTRRLSLVPAPKPPRKPRRRVGHRA